MLWDQIKSADIDRFDRATPVVVPLAATEQHGPHLPLATDRMIADHFARGLDAEFGDRVLIAPVQAIGCSEHHMGFAGSLSLSHRSFEACILDLLDSIRRHGFNRLLLLNAHGGNQAVGGVIQERFGAANPDCRVVFTSWWQVAREELLALNATGRGGVGHACEFETSLMLLIAPDLVDCDAIPERDGTCDFEWAAADMLRGAPANFYRSMRAMTRHGVVGDPAAASPELGRRITKAVLSALKPIIQDLAS